MTWADQVWQRVRVVAEVRIVCGCSRRGLLSSTALQAVTAVAVLGLVQPAQAQLSPSARPSGGQVVAGQASIAQSANRTTVTQGSQNAAVNWQSYNVGSAQTVQYVDPSSRSMTLNRVIGPNPSEIAGHIVSNGTVVIVNQAGLLFDKGAQVNTAGLVASAAGISTGNFMAGKLAFDQAANPGAKVENRGTITIKDEGLAALVAPRVANSGVIRANLGKVILAGAEASVLDLYGDGMLSINVTKQVTTAPDGGAALVTNTGAITARGGTVVLTARAVDGVVQTLVNAGGKISADTAGTQTGRVVIAGAGGDVVVTGAVSANGHAAGSTGGAVVVNTTGTVAVASTARISASGPAAGGTIAIGTTLKRAAGGPSVTGQRTAAAVKIAAGATIAADATANGHGGRVTVLSTQQTTMAGTITAKGGTSGGDGGSVEVSGQVLALTGHVDATAPFGHAGTLLLDPADLYISDASPTISAIGTVSGSVIAVAGTASWLSPAVLQSQSADISLSAFDDIFFASGTAGANALGLGRHQLSATAGTDLTVDRGFTISAGGISLATTAGSITLGGSSGVGAGLISGTQIATLGATALLGTSVTLSAGEGIALGDARLGSGLAPLGTLSLNASFGGVTQSAAGGINAGMVESAGVIGGSVSLLANANMIANLGALEVTGGIAIADAAALNIADTVAAEGDFYLRSLSAGGIAIGATGRVIAGATSKASFQADAFTIAAGGTVTGGVFELAPGTTLTPITLGAGGYPGSLSGIGPVDVRIGAVTLPGSTTATTYAGTITIGSSFGSTSTNLELDSKGGIIQSSGAIVSAATLSGSAAGDVSLTQTNAVASLGRFAVTNGGTLSLIDGGSLAVTGLVSAASISLRADTLGIVGTVSAPGLVALGAGSGGISESGAIKAGTLASIGTIGGGATLSGSNTIAALGSLGVDGDLILADGGVLTVNGPLTALDVTLGAGSIIVPGVIGASGSLVALSGTTGVNQASSGIISANFGAVTITTGPAGAIALAGSVGAGSRIALSAGSGGIRQTDGLLNTAGTLSLAALGNGVTQAAKATIDAGTLVNSAALAGTVSLAGTSNAIGTIASVAVTAGDFSLVDTGTASMAGVLEAANISVTAGSIDVPGSIIATDTRVSLFGTLGIHESGLVQAGTIAANTGTASLSTGPAGGIALSGSVLAGTLIALSAGTGGIDQTAGLLNAGTKGVLSLAALGGGVTQAAGGTIDAGTLVSGPTLVGTVGLYNTSSNAVCSIGSLAVASGDFVLFDTGTVTVAGPLTADNVWVVAGSIVSPGTIIATGTYVELDGSSGVVQSGLINASEMAIDSTYGGVALSGDLTGGFILLSAGAGGISQTAGTVYAGTAGLLQIATAGTVTQTGGTIIARTLSSSSTLFAGTIGGSVDLLGTTNTIQSIGTIAATGDFALEDTGLLTVGGPLTAANVALNAGSIVVSGSIGGTGSLIALTGTSGIHEAFGGVLNAGAAGKLSLSGSGDVTQDPGAAITAGTLVSSGTVGGSVALTEAANAIPSVGSFAASGDFNLADTGSLTVAGKLTAANIMLISPTITVTGGIGITGSLIALTGTSGIDEASTGIVNAGAHGTLSLSTGGNVTQHTGAVITAGTLVSSGTIGGTVDLAETANGVTSIGSFAAAGDFNLADVGTVTVAGTLTAANVTLSAGSIIVPGSVGITGSLIALTGTTGIDEKSGGVLNAGPAGTLSLASGGNVTEDSSATIDAGTLVTSGTIGGTVALPGTGNAIGNIGPLIASGDIQLLDSADLTIVTGALVQSLVGNIYLQSSGPGGITFGANSTLAARTVGLQTGRLTNLGASGATGLVTSGTFELAPGGTLFPVVSLGTAAAGLSLETLDGIKASRVRIGAVTRPGGANPVTTAGSIAIGGTGFAATSGNVLELDVTNDVGQTATAPLSANTLTGSAGSFTLTNPGNAIGTIGLASGGALGSLDATGTIIVKDRTNLAIAGLIQAGGDTTISVPGTLTLLGQVTSPEGNVWLNAGSIIVSGTLLPRVEALDAVKLTATGLRQEAGVIDGGSVTINAASATLDKGLIVATTGTVGITSSVVSVGSSETIAAVDSANAVSFSGDVALAGYIGANRNITVGGTLTEQAGGSLLAIGTVSLGGLTQNGGLINAGGALSIGSGTLVTGWAGSGAGSGSFDQSGGTAAAAGNIDIFTTDVFSQSADAVLAAGGTLGVTASNGISVGGTVSAAGTLSGFMLLASGGNALLATTGLLAGPATVAHGGNALQAPAGTVLIAGTAGTPGFGQAGTVGGAGPLSGGYTSGTSSGVTPLTILTIGPAVTGGAVIPARLIGGVVDIERPIAATTLGLYAQTSIVEGTHGAIAAGIITGSAGVPASGTLAAGLAALGWTDAATIGWADGTAGSVTLKPSGAVNAFGTLSNFSVTGDFALTDAHDLTQTGTVQAGKGAASGNTTTIAVTGSLAVDGLIATDNGDTYLSSSGDLAVEAAGTVTANAGAVTLTSGSAVILEGSVLAGTLIALSAGPAGIGQSAGLVSVGTGGTTGIISLAASGGRVVQSGGTIIAGTLTSGGTVTGSVDLSASNTIGTVGGFAATGDFNLLDTGTVSVAGPVYARNVTLSAGTIGIAGSLGAGTLIALSAGAGGIRETSGTLDAGTGTLSLVSGGDITQPGGAIIAGTLISGGTLAGSVDLSASNAIGAIGRFAATGDFNLLDTGTVSIAGPVYGRDVTLSADAIGIAGSVRAGTLIALSAGTGGIVETSSGSLSGPSVSLAAAGGGVDQNGGTIIAGTLITGASVTGSVVLTASNTIAAIGLFTASGDFDLADSGPVSVNARLQANNVTLTAGSIAVPGSIIATGSLIALSGTTGVNESGLLSAATITAHTGAAGAIALSGSTGAEALIALVAGTGGISQTAGTLDARTVSLSSTGTVGQSGGTIIAGTLISNLGITNGVSLTASNTIATIGSLAVASGDFVLADTGAVTVAGPLSADNVGISAGSIYVTGSIRATASAIDLLGTSGMTDSGVLHATNVTLETGSTGAIALSGTVDAVTLTLSAGSGGISQTSGVLDAGAGGTLSLSTLGGGVTQSGGTIITGTLLSNTGIAGTVSLQASNTIGAVGSVAVTSGDFTLSDSSALSLSGPLTANNVTVTAPTMTASGIIDAPGGNVSLTAASTFAQTAGVITGGNVAVTASNASLSEGAIVATSGTVGIFAPSVTVSAGETIAALNAATGVAFSGNATQSAASYIGSNGLVSVAGLLTENGGILLAAGGVTLGGLAEIGGTIAAGQALAIGGSFNQSGGVLAATGDANISTAGVFTQSAGFVATGGTLGVTANGGIDIGGTVSAAGPASGFTLLAGNGDVVLETTGLLAGPSPSFTAASIPVNAVLAPAGTIRIAGPSGTQGFGEAGAVGGIEAVSGYQVPIPASTASTASTFSLSNTASTAATTIAKTAPTRISTPYMSSPSMAAPTAAAVPIRLSGAAIDIERPVTASTLGLYAVGTITEGSTAAIQAARLTGSSGADVNLLQANAIGTLGAFADSGHGFHLVDASNLMLAGLLTANSVWIEDASYAIDVTTGSAFAGLGAGSSSPTNKDTFPAAGSPGVYLLAADFAVPENPAVATGSIVNWTFALSGDGNVDFGAFRQPEVKVFLSLDTGTASGEVYIPGLQFTYTTATSKTINLTGSVGGLAGQDAASDSHISPRPKNNYQINGCPISSVDCIKFTGLTVPVSNPLQDVLTGQSTDLDDADSVLPDVAERDY